MASKSWVLKQQKLDPVFFFWISVSNEFGCTTGLSRALRGKLEPESLIEHIHKWRLFYFCSVIVQISLPSLALEQEFFSI